MITIIIFFSPSSFLCNMSSILPHPESAGIYLILRDKIVFFSPKTSGPSSRSLNVSFAANLSDPNITHGIKHHLPRWQAEEIGKSKIQAKLIYPAENQREKGKCHWLWGVSLMERMIDEKKRAGLDFFYFCGFVFRENLMTVMAQCYWYKKYDLGTESKVN